MPLKDIGQVRTTWEADLLEMDEVCRMVFLPLGYSRLEALIMLKLNQLLNRLDELIDTLEEQPPP